MRKNEGVQQMEKVDAGRMGGNKKNLHTRVTAQTYRKLEQWAIVEKCALAEWWISWSETG